MNEKNKNIRILIADDEERLLRVLRLGLKPLGYEITTVNSAEEAIQQLCQKPFDIVLTDIRMGDMSGVELVYEMERLQINTPVIVMTAYADVNTAVKSLKHGARDYIQKPFTVDELDKLIRNVHAQVQTGAGEDDPLPSLDEGISEKEKELILRALERADHVKAKAAKLLKVSERTLWYKLKKYNIQ